jgi:putative hydrolase of the HAD superfamily
MIPARERMMLPHTSHQRSEDLPMKYLIWDFDGTLGYRAGMWTGTLLEVLHRDMPGHGYTEEEIRPHLQAGFPWHAPELSHADIESAGEWWDALDQLFERAFGAVGVEPQQAGILAQRVRDLYPLPEYWQLFDDAIPALRELSARGWTHIILSNHVPELGSILHALGIDEYFAHVFNSADTGYEKPHPQAFANVMEIIGKDGEVWMIGDSLESDIRGAARAGIPAILVRSRHDDAGYCCADLLELPDVIDRATARA